MGTTPNFNLPFPEGSDVFDVRSDLENLAQSADEAIPRITQGDGAPPSSGMKAGDIHCVWED